MMRARVRRGSCGTGTLFGKEKVFCTWSFGKTDLWSSWDLNGACRSATRPLPFGKGARLCCESSVCKGDSSRNLSK
ncbi:unnamed protein product [Prunus armeniaca]|uniref:Uncharacterized protein n=1 Tax=Prunus armeniaca TaxID=36596 RepID=A0A6J5V8X6_PRUAR|nr:unnamed protein product [Prunus armeniaca]CAB4315820.1 unnamed protein product [Prunus armeniaca]